MRLRPHIEERVHEHLTDCEIIVASRGRPELFEVIFERHYQAVFRFAAGRHLPVRRCTHSCRRCPWTYVMDAA